MKKHFYGDYLAPEIEVTTIAVEAGFAVTNLSNNTIADMEEVEW